VIKALFLACIGLGVAASSTSAFDWRVRSTISESLEFNDNRNMAAVPRGDSYLSVTSLLFNADAVTPTSRLNINTDLAYRAYAGSAEENTKNTLDKGISASFAKSEKLTTYNVSASWREFETAAVQLEETGVATLAGSTTTTTVAGGFRHRLNPRDSIAWQTTWTSTVPQGGTTVETLSSNFDFAHNVNPLLDVVSSIRAQHLTYSTGADVMFWTASMTMNLRPTQRLTVRGSLGLVYVDAKPGAGAAPTAPIGEIPSGGTATDWIGDIFVGYDLTRQMRLGLNAGRSTGPNTFGEFSKTDTIGASFSYDVNRDSSVSLSASFTEQTVLAGSPAETLAASIGYSYRLTQEWNTHTSYRFTQRNSSGTSAQSNAVLFVVTRDYVVLP
jgi:hypothetical protein